MSERPLEDLQDGTHPGSMSEVEINTLIYDQEQGGRVESAEHKRSWNETHCVCGMSWFSDGHIPVIEAQARADERRRVIEALRRLKEIKPPDQRDVDYALQRIEESGGIVGLIHDLNDATRENGGE